jgi:hypothetical protein
MCEVCDRYHVRLVKGKYPISDDWQKILELIARGFSARDIAPQVGLTWRSLQFRIGQIEAHFYAMNVANLVAITCALGVIRPNSFIPIVEETHVDTPS